GAGDFYYPAIATNAGLDIDYKLTPEGSYAYLRVATNLNYQYQKYHRWDIQVGNSVANFTADSTSAFQTALPVASSVAQTYSTQFTKKSQNYSINPGIELKLFQNTATLDIDYSHSWANIWYPGWHNVTAASGPVGWQLDFRSGDQFLPVLTQ